MDILSDSKDLAKEKLYTESCEGKGKVIPLQARYSSILP